MSRRVNGPQDLPWMREAFTRNRGDEAVDVQQHLASAGLAWVHRDVITLALASVNDDHVLWPTLDDVVERNVTYFCWGDEVGEASSLFGVRTQSGFSGHMIGMALSQDMSGVHRSVMVTGLWRVSTDEDSAIVASPIVEVVFDGGDGGWNGLSRLQHKISLAMTEVGYARMLATMLAMINSPRLVEPRPVKPLHRDIKKAKKEGRKPDPITAYELRPLRHVETTHDASGRKLSCRFVVRGHWRKQWMPKAKTHRPTFIEPYIKGPTGAPLRMPKERVGVLRA